MLRKLDNYGIRGHALDWFKSYLTGREQYVYYKGVSSNVLSVECGVPQGSVLGPLLFILYINDLSKCLKLTKAILFADDSTVYKAGINKRKLIADVKKDLIELTLWFRANKLSLNLGKTNLIIFKPPKLKLNNDEADQLHDVLEIENTIINQKQSCKFLGMIIDENLNWTAHCKFLTSKLSRSLYIMNSVKNLLPTSCMKTIYHSLFNSHLIYGILLWGPSTLSANRDRIIKMQKRAIRIVSNSSYNAHTGPIFRTNNILNVKDSIDLEILKFMYLFTNQKLPQPLSDLFTANRNVHNYHTRNRNDPRSHTRMYSSLANSFLGKGPSMWATLTDELKHKPSIKSFVRSIKGTKLAAY